LEKVTDEQAFKVKEVSYWELLANHYENYKYIPSIELKAIE
jgi:hypothetical protein